MEREHRYLDGKRQEECQEQENGIRHAVSRVVENVRSRLIEGLNTERVFAGLMVVVEVQEQHREEHQHGAEQRV